MNANGLTWSGRVIAWLWAGFWLWFVTCSLLAEKHPWDGIVHIGLPAALVLAAAVAAWFRPPVAGALLLAEGFALAGLMACGWLLPNSPTKALFLTLALVLPPVVAGVLLLLGRPHGTVPAPHSATRA